MLTCLDPDDFYLTCTLAIFFMSLNLSYDVDKWELLGGGMCMAWNRDGLRD